MHGYLLLKFKLEDVLQEGESVPRSLGDKFANLPGFCFTGNLGADGFAKVDGEFVRVRTSLDLDLLTNQIFPEWDEPIMKIKLYSVVLQCWVSVDRTRPERLSAGTWSEGRIGGRILNDPSQNDHTRMSITIRAPSVAEARENLLAVLEGKKKLTTLWIV